jgi:hypothetical protein
VVIWFGKDEGQRGMKGMVEDGKEVLLAGMKLV